MSAVPARKIGAHVSAAGGVEKAIERAAKIGCNCVQLFSGSPRVWTKPDLTRIDPDKIASESSKQNVSPIFTHALYLVNLASDKPELVKKSLDSLKYELQFDALVRGAGVVVHLGSHQGRGFTAVQEQLVTQIDALLRQTPANSRLLIENAASRNGKIGGDLSEISYLLTQLEKQGNWVAQGRLGWCFDTCHAFAAGYNLGEQFQPGTLSAGQLLPDQSPLSAFQVLSDLGLCDALACIHVNDSKDAFASNRDRHANLGEGTIPQDDLRWLLHRSELMTVPLIMEAPGFDGKGPDAENIHRLKDLL